MRLETDGDLKRVPPTCAARCARGGKAAFLETLGLRLLGTSRTKKPLFVTFNGESKVRRRQGEGADGWLYRSIAHALLQGDSLKGRVAEELGGLTCEKGVLQTYVKDKENMVLHVDELTADREERE